MLKMILMLMFGFILGYCTNKEIHFEINYKGKDRGGISKMEENNKIRSMEEKNKIKTGDTFKIRITFDIDVPRNMEDSIVNSIIMGIHQYKMIKEDTNIPQKYKNELLINIQREIDNLIILDEKSF